MKKGFTLIELLVVVLIIGILASIAVPQYQKAVAKAKLVEGMVQARALVDAQKRYNMATGKAMTEDLDSLDVELKGNWICSTSGGGTTCSYQEIVEGVSLLVSNYYGNDKLSIFCNADPDKKLSDYLCKSIGGEFVRTHPDTGNNSYVFYK